MTGPNILFGEDVYADTMNGNPYITSDARLKTDIVRLKHPLEMVSKLRGVYYSWTQDLLASKNTTFDFSKDRQVGVIAQDVQRVLPEAVQPIFDDEYLGVRYHMLIPLLIESVQELDRRPRSSVTEEIMAELLATLTELARKYEQHEADVKMLKELEAELVGY